MRWTLDSMFSPFNAGQHPKKAAFGLRGDTSSCEAETDLLSDSQRHLPARRPAVRPYVEHTSNVRELQSPNAQVAYNL